jgi:hypothetical protein
LRSGSAGDSYRGRSAQCNLSPRHQDLRKLFDDENNFSAYPSSRKLSPQ